MSDGVGTSAPVNDAPGHKSGGGGSELPMKYIVRAGEVTFVCYSQQSVNKWVAFILARGGVPTITSEDENENNTNDNKNA